MRLPTNVFAAKAFPVAEDFFEPLVLEQEYLSALRVEAASALRRTLAECLQYQKTRSTYLVDCSPWQLTAEHDGLYHYSRAHKTRPTLTSSRVFGTVDGDFREIADFFKAETRSEYLNVQKMLSKQALDAHVLRMLPRSGCAYPVTSESVKWAAFGSFAPRSRMDSCHFESMGSGFDANGRPYAFRVIIPAVFDQVPDLFAAKRTVRIYHKSVMIVTPSARDDNSTELYIGMENDYNGARVTRRAHKKHLMSLKKIATFVDLQRVAFAARTPEVPEKRRSKCSVCARSFSFLRAKHACTVCSDLVCRRCLVTTPVETPTKVVSKMCSPCHQQLRQPVDDLTVPVMEDDESSYDNFLASYVRVGRKSSAAGWVTSPTHKTRGRIFTDASVATDLSSSYYSEAGDEYPRSPVIAILGSGVDQIEYIEEERSRAISVELTLDTKDMTPVREGFTFPASLQSASPSDLLHSIHSSLHEQEALLREIHTQQSFRAHRYTRKQDDLVLSDL